MRGFGWIPLGGMLLILASGCGGEKGTNVVTAVTTQLGDANVKLLTIKTKLKEAVDKGDEKNPAATELKEAVEAVKELSNIPAEFQKILLRNTRKGEISEEEKRQAIKRGASGLNEALKTLNETVRDLDQQIVAARSKYGDKIKELNDKIDTAMAEFRNLGAQQK